MTGFAQEYGTFPAVSRATIPGQAHHGALVERLIDASPGEYSAPKKGNAGALLRRRFARLTTIATLLCARRPEPQGFFSSFMMLRPILICQ
jgi:hypothetical protein